MTIIKQFIITVLLLSYTIIYSQLAPPQAFSYSGAAMDNIGNPLVNQTIGVQFSILKGSNIGSVQYSETHFTTTNQFGLFTLMLGTGSNQQGSFSGINWGNDAYYLKVGMDITGGSNYQVMGITQFLSVPYALYAGVATNPNDNDTSANNEIQNLSITGNTISISQGNQINLPIDNDTSSSNELQVLSVSGDTLRISQGNYVIMPRTTPKIRINGVLINDPTINDYRLDGSIYVTENNYRYVMGHTSIFSDSATIGTQVLYSSNANCNSPYYVGASDYPCTNIILTDIYLVKPGWVFGSSINGNYSFWYVPHNATPVSISSAYQVESCLHLANNCMVYQCLPNNPAITGFNFNNYKVEMIFER